ncbi:hypothetical protein ABT095_29575 [Kitasatospora sp. NPDC002227]|uniref:efflux RND transporter periplasmic adaptor subunit n=1 Tax=Kitasatospora sp. NPDC002227 TaxID=3154773 RepID=UPI0033302DC1
MSSVRVRPLVRWTALGSAVAVAAAVALVTRSEERHRDLFTVEPTTVALTAVTRGVLQPDARYMLFFGRVVPVPTREPLAGNPCDWFPGLADPARLLGAVTSLSAVAGAHVAAGAVLARADAGPAKSELEAATRALADDRALLAADRRLAADVGRPASVEALPVSVAPGAESASPPSVAPDPSQQQLAANAQVSADQQRTAAAEKRLAEAQGAVDAASVTAPVEGVVDTVETALGATPSCRLPVVTMHSDRLVVLADVPGSLLPRLVVGQTVTVTPADAQGTLRTTLTALPPQALPSAAAADTTPAPAFRSPAPAASGEPVYPLALSLPGAPAGLRPGMPARMTVVLQQRANVLAVPTNALRTEAGGTFVTVVRCAKDDGAQCRDASEIPTRVDTGLVGDSLTEITAGLAPNDRILLPGPPPPPAPVPPSPPSPPGPGPDPAAAQGGKPEAAASP